MGFYEDDRIRHKNQKAGVHPTWTEPKLPINLVIDDSCSITDILETLRDAKFKVSLFGSNTIIIE